ncbi:MAG TPA: sodium:solute symporter [Chitinophagaceae bacterium]|nr:sodium:solute symporter [Chitinophagaceae bacterium]MCC6635612.1 sodium:solute symporter [Chitinophagaceae bacterium]HMZ46616.1 sodium:solute symporter [Chitinophagaceae bacterium]HNE93100.1 sodium:solute symporter [Chitinophagaceae bacterium]HNF29681.1 sodium:solute symporter [Chitinophagaceae bacterium]
MSPIVLFSFVIGYFLLLLAVAWYTSKNANNDSFFIGNKNSNWMLVAFGMVGTSLSGVTFVSVPGTVGSAGFQYFQVVIGYCIGYLAVAYILLPLYYKMNLTSIYNYLEHRFGNYSYKTGALFFILSRTLGATARLYLVINILQLFILDSMGVSFWVTTLIILALIVLYTFEGGVKTIVYTDTLQTTCMLLGLLVCIVAIMSKMDLSLSNSIHALSDKGMLQIFNTDIHSSGFFLKQIIGGAFITITMTGLDQEMMQKNISVRTLKDSQKNVLTLSVILFFVNLLFLFMGGLLYLYAGQNGITSKGDDLFPFIALNSHFSVAVAVIFIIGLISALFPSADGALTALTSSFCIDILGLKKKTQFTEQQKKRTRLTVHFTFTIIFFLCVLAFKWINDKSIIDVILKVAGYTYGPLLGLFAFGIFSKRKINDKLSVVVCLIAPVLVIGIDIINNSEWFIHKLNITGSIANSLQNLSQQIFNGFRIGIELLIINGLFTFIGLYIISKPAPKS